MENTNNITSEELRAAFTGEGKEPVKTNTKTSKIEKKGDEDRRFLVFLIIGILGLIGGSIMLIVAVFGMRVNSPADNYPDLTSNEEKDGMYSHLTGEVLSDEAALSAPAYCVQTPNGTDGARPQAGLDQAGVIFEAIAEAGITRFAAIYQNPTSAVIGPIRSLRIYYLEWDTPFDCTIVHAGGSGDALAAVSSGGYSDLSEDYNYMYRGNAGARRWNNLFTTSALLRKYSSDSGNATSNIKGFNRMTPDESERARVEGTASEVLKITSPAKGDTSTMAPVVSSVSLRFGGIPSFNVKYQYDEATNKYFRSYENGDAHEVYGCPSDELGEVNPESSCTLTQMAPSVVVAMLVSERRASDNYHEDIDTIGSGKAFIFQNGMAITGRWEKGSKADQIKFIDDDGNEIKLAPGQTFVSAVPDYGSVDY